MHSLIFPCMNELNILRSLFVCLKIGLFSVRDTGISAPYYHTEKKHVGGAAAILPSQITKNVPRNIEKVVWFTIELPSCTTLISQCLSSFRNTLDTICHGFHMLSSFLPVLSGDARVVM